MTVHHLTLRGTNFEIGRRLGELAIQRHCKSPGDYSTNPVYARARRLYFQHNYPVHWDRVRGVAAAFAVDANDDRFDFTNIPYNLDVAAPAPGCSVVYYPPSTTASGTGYLSRNYDFPIGTMADLLRMPVPPEVNARMPRVMREPYIMEWYPEDRGMPRWRSMPSIPFQALWTASTVVDWLSRSWRMKKRWRHWVHTEHRSDYLKFQLAH
jgi:hypothetical protein